MKLSQHNRRLFKELKALDLPNDQYVVFGSGPMGIRNLKQIGDIDLFTTPELWRHLSEKYGLDEAEPAKLSPNIEAFRTWSSTSWDIDKLILEGDLIEGLRFAPLKAVLEWKKKRNKEKDLKDIKIIEKYLASGKK